MRVVSHRSQKYLTRPSYRKDNPILKLGRICAVALALIGIEAAGRKAVAHWPEAHRSRPTYPAGAVVRAAQGRPQGLLRLSGAGEARCWRMGC
jgi:hypothetical protein